MCDDTCVCLRRLAFDFPSLSRDIKHQTRINNQRKTTPQNENSR